MGGIVAFEVETGGLFPTKLERVALGLLREERRCARMTQGEPPSGCRAAVPR